jgi:isopentenyl-diphosphate delta-isomerase
MKKVTSTESRKADHIRINLEEDVSSKLTTGLENYRFVHEALPDINLDEITLNQGLFGKLVQIPLLISSMTGGTEQAATINANLAAAAQDTGIAMGVGSQRAAIEEPELASTFQVRRYAPDILLFANLGAVQLNYGYGIQECKRAVEMIHADALILHLNSLQEAIQPEGDTRFKGLLTKLEQITKDLGVPVIAKEVGWGISASTAKRLADAGVAAIDVAGAGGTSWSQVEMHRADSESQARIAEQFINWGIPTAESIIQVREAVPEIPIIASGGLRTGMDIAKSIALGAFLGGMASPFLKAATQSESAVIGLIRETGQLIRTIMFGVGARDLKDLKNPNLLTKVQ